MWFRVDDKLPNHAKTRRVRKTHPTKRRDAAPFGLWVLAGAFSDDGFIPLEVLEDWDDDAEELADRLVCAGLWEECEQAGEVGYRFHDWAAHNPVDAATSGIYGNHKRWHVGGKKPSDGCPLCISEGLVEQKPIGKAERGNLSGRLAPDSPPIIAPESGGCIAPDSLPDPIRPDPTRSDPTRSDPSKSPRSTDVEPVRPAVNRFDEFWTAYPRKVGKEKARTKYATACKKATPDAIIAGAYRLANDPNLPDKQFIPHPTTWLERGSWTDEPLPQRQPEAIDRRQQATDDLFAAAARRMGVTPQPPHNHLTIEGTVA